jgi:hypothetical protein
MFSFFKKKFFILLDIFEKKMNSELNKSITTNEDFDNFKNGMIGFLNGGILKEAIQLPNYYKLIYLLSDGKKVCIFDGDLKRFENKKYKKSFT